MGNLKNVLLVNALSSGTTGAILFLTSDTVAAVFTTDKTPAFIGVEVFPIMFAMLIYIITRQKTINSKVVRTRIGADTLWVIISLIILAFQYSRARWWITLSFAQSQFGLLRKPYQSNFSSPNSTKHESE